MKQLLTIILVVCLLLIIGCSSKSHINESTMSEITDYKESQQDTTVTSPKETPNADSNPTLPEGGDDITDKPKVSTENSINKTDSEVKGDNKEPQQSFDGTTLKKDNSSATMATEKPKEEIKDNSSYSVPDIPNATAADVKAIAKKTVEYINIYRAEQGVPATTVLPGLTEYAEYRSRQLISNFAHDTLDERAAATALQYGEYIDPPLYGMTGEPYYTVNAREAILKVGYIGSIDSVAERIALLTRNSVSHWNYVGNEKYCYIAIGITYESGLWYCDIAVSIGNTDN